MKVYMYCLLLLISISASTQYSFEDLRNGACSCISKIDGSASIDKRQKRSTKCIKSAYKDFKGVLIAERSAFFTENPNATDLEYGQFIQRKISNTLIESCDNFFEIITSSMLAKPQFANIPRSEYMDSIATEICHCIEQKPILTDKIVDDCIVPRFEITSAAFNDAISKDPNFVQNSTFLLMQICKPFAKFSLKNGPF